MGLISYNHVNEVLMNLINLNHAKGLFVSICAQSNPTMFIKWFTRVVLCYLYNNELRSCRVILT